MAAVRDILYNVRITSTVGDMDVDVKGIAFDSRKVEPGFLFVAVKGTQADGHAFIDKSITLGATVIVCNSLPEATNNSVTYVTVKDSALALGVICGNFYGNPSKKLKLVGVTGTNGKTTVATLLFQLFTAMGKKCGLLSTVENRIVDKVLPATHTTPDPIQINLLLNQMLEEGCTHAFMEVSSHACAQGRIEGLHFVEACLPTSPTTISTTITPSRATSAPRRSSLTVCHPMLLPS